MVANILGRLEGFAIPTAGVRSGKVWRSRQVNWTPVVGRWRMKEQVHQADQ